MTRIIISYTQNVTNYQNYKVYYVYVYIQRLRSTIKVNESCVPVLTIRYGSVHNDCHDRNRGVASSKTILICRFFSPVSVTFPLHARWIQKSTCHMLSPEIILYSSHPQRRLLEIIKRKLTCCSQKQNREVPKIQHAPRSSVLCFNLY